MRTGIALAQLRKEVLLEAGYSVDPGHAAVHKEYVDQLLRRTERMLAREFDWQASKIETLVIVAANAATVSLPPLIDFTDIDSVSVLYSQAWLPVTHGIGPQERSIYTAGDRITPITRWEVHYPGTSTFEVWPVGEVEQTLRFVGMRKIGGFIDDTDACFIDADVLVMYAAAEMLARDKKSDADFKLDRARRYAQHLVKAQGSTKAAPVSQGQRSQTGPRPYLDYMPHGGS